jgi:hypothetical protein
MVVLGVPVALLLAMPGLDRMLGGAGTVLLAVGAELARALACSWCSAGSAMARSVVDAGVRHVTSGVLLCRRVARTAPAPGGRP